MSKFIQSLFRFCFTSAKMTRRESGQCYFGGWWFEPFKADVVIATLPFISSGLWDSSINNLMTRCFWVWSMILSHTHIHTTLTLMMCNLCWHPVFFLHLSLQILRRADKNGKYCTIHFLFILSPVFRITPASCLSSMWKIWTVLSECNSDHDSLLILFQFLWQQETDHAQRYSVRDH